MSESLSLVLLVILLGLVVVILIALLLQVLQKMQELSSRQNKALEEVTSTQAQVTLAAMNLVAQATNLIASQDAITYQALQASTSMLVPSVSNNDEEEEEEPLDESQFNGLLEKVMRGEASADEYARFERAARGE